MGVPWLAAATMCCVADARPSWVATSSGLSTSLRATLLRLLRLACSPTGKLTLHAARVTFNMLNAGYSFIRRCRISVIYS